MRPAFAALCIAGVLVGASSAGNPTPVIPGALPGIAVPLSAEAERAGATHVSRLLITGDGDQRTPLLVGVGRHRELCMGSIGLFRCYARHDALPAYAMVVFRGARSEAITGVVVGLVSARVNRVTVKLQDGTVETPRLTHWSGFPWAAFTSDISGPNGRFPYSITLYGSRGGHYENSGDISFFRTPDTMRKRSAPVPEAMDERWRHLRPLPERLYGTGKGNRTAERLRSEADQGCRLHDRALALGAAL
jgi:hypothetical protein